MPDELEGLEITNKAITFNTNNTLNVMVVLIPFNCLFDTNVGLIKLINLNYNDPRVFDKNTLDSLDSNLKVTKFSYESTSENIIMDLLINKDIEVANAYYQQFLEEQYQNILNYSVYTGLINLLSKLMDQPDVNVSVFCMNELEANFIHNNLSDQVRTVLPDETIEHINMYKQFYFKTSVNDPYFDTIYKYLHKVFVYMLDYAINFNSEGKFIETPKIDELRRNLVTFNAISTHQSQFYDYIKGEDNNNEN